MIRPCFISLLTLLWLASLRADESTPPSTITVVVQDTEGRPVAGATVKRAVWTEQKDFDRSTDFTTDVEGRATVTLPQTMRILRLWVTKENHPPLFANFDGKAIEQVPNEFIVVVPKATSVGGIVLDQDGKPIAGAKVNVTFDKGGEPLGHPSLRYSTWLANDEDAAVTGADGRWRVDNVPPGEDVNLDLQLRHDDFVDDQRRGDMQVAQGVTMERLRQQAAVITMDRGAILRGRVVNAAGMPIEGTALHWSHEERDHGVDMLATTDGDGEFSSPPIAPGPLFVTAVTENFAPRRTEITLSTNTPPLELKLSAGGTLKIRVVDAEGRAIPDAELAVASWSSLYPAVRGRGLPLFDVCPMPSSDENGESVWDSAPEDGVEVLVRKKGWSRATAELFPSSRVQEIELPKQAIISGTVVDDQTGEPIQNAELIPVSHYPNRPDDPIVQKSQVQYLSDGKFQYTESDWTNGIELILQFQALGYRPVRIGPFGPASGEITREVRLPSAPDLTGQVVDPSGKPVQGASVTYATKDITVMANEWTYRDMGLSDLVVRTDQDGYFRMPQPFNTPHLIATHEDGFAEVTLNKGETTGVLELKPWARVEGRLERHGHGVVGERIYLAPIRMLGGENPGVQDRFAATTDGQGRFVFDRVPPLPSSLNAYVSVWSDTKLKSAKQVPLDLQPGKTHQVNLGGGVTIRGVVRPTGELASQLDMNYCLNFLFKNAPGITPPDSVAQAGFDWQSGWSFNLFDSTEGRGFMNTMTHYFVKFEPDGSFVIHGVEPGKYQFATSIHEPPEGCLVDPVGRKVIDVDVDDQAVSRGELDMGTIEVDVSLGPQVGEPFPNFRFETMDEDELQTVSTYRGRYLLIDCWATWCAPCIAAIPELRRAAASWDEDRVAVLSVSLDDDAAKARRFIREQDMSWPQGLLGSRDNGFTRSQLGISSVPVHFVLDGDGKLLHRTLKLDDAIDFLNRQLAKAEPQSGSTQNE